MPVQHIYRSSPSGEGLFYGWFPAMHTRVDIALYGCRSESEWLEMTERIYREILRLESVGNCYDEKSELAYVNRNASAHPVALSDELYEMIAICMESHALTMKCFDVTVHSRNYSPATMMNVRLDKDRRTLFYECPDIFINLSGFIKGYALEKIRVLLKDNGVEHALVNLGNSSIMAMGNHPNGNGWKVGDKFLLHNRCLTVSGNDSNARKHIVSPLTGRLVEGQASVSVVTESAYMGEVISTALFAATDEQRALLLEALAPLIIEHLFNFDNRI